MQIKPGTFCPLIKEDCIQLKCSWFTQVRGTNPNTGKEVDEWACAIAWMPMLMIENSQQQRIVNSKDKPGLRLSHLETKWQKLTKKARRFCCKPQTSGV